MRWIFLLLILASSCQENNLRKSAPQTYSTVTEDYLTVNGPIDLLDVVVDLDVKISSGEIIFNAQGLAVDVGDHSTYEIKIQQGDIYRYSFQGDDLRLMYPNGLNLIFNRISGDLGELSGVWRNERRVGSQLIKTRISILNSERFILRSHCEA